MSLYRAKSLLQAVDIGELKELPMSSYSDELTQAQKYALSVTLGPPKVETDLQSLFRRQSTFSQNPLGHSVQPNYRLLIDGTCEMLCNHQTLNASFASVG